MRVDLFDFDLPDDRIALRPQTPRDAARMLVVQPGAEPPFVDRVVRDLPGLLRPGDALVLNDTRVIPARLVGLRARGEATARVEIMLHKREGADRWRAFARPAKRLSPGDRIRFGEDSESMACLLASLDAEVEEKGEGGEVVLRFAFTGPALDEAVARLGETPLPPYIAGKRTADSRDQADYQTVYARVEGAVAAPTAGLHFTDELFARLEARGVSRHFVTLHVGAGTFLPVKAEDTADHRMHAEWGEIDAETAAALNAARRAGGRVVAVGTTALRLLESAARPDGTVQPFAGETDLFIAPGYAFRAVDVLMTNFHLPRSTLFMLVSAFAGLDTMQATYAHAIASGYRFYSYGDACLLFRDDASSRPEHSGEPGSFSD
jgi:S-adenosylmethionine:tRNA ribosyltransferase-isomerase